MIMILYCLLKSLLSKKVYQKTNVVSHRGSQLSFSGAVTNDLSSHIDDVTINDSLISHRLNSFLVLGVQHVPTVRTVGVQKGRVKITSTTATQCDRVTYKCDCEHGVLTERLPIYHDEEYKPQQ